MNSCEDMLEIDTTRVDHEFNDLTLNDSVYSVLGIVKSVQNVADRHVLFGELRGDLVVPNEGKAVLDIQGICNFDFDPENPYLAVKDYYAIINNCNVFLARVDTTIERSNQKLMLREFVAVKSIRAWTYLQLAINYGSIPYFTEPILTHGAATEVTSRANLTKDSKLTVDMVKRIVAKLRAANAPTINGKYVAIIHPYVAYDLMSDPRWIEAHQYAKPENLFEGEIGEIGGVRFVESSEAKIYTGDGCPDGLAVFGSLFMGANAYGVTEITGGGMQTIVKQKGSAGSADPLDQRSSIGWKGILTAEILIPAYLVRVESCSEFSTTAQAN